jgi:hypothetical protein
MLQSALRGKNGAITVLDVEKCFLEGRDLKDRI